MDDNGFDPSSLNDDDNKPVTLPSAGIPASEPVIEDAGTSRTIRWVTIVSVIAVCCLITAVMYAYSYLKSSFARPLPFPMPIATTVPTEIIFSTTRPPILFPTPHFLVWAPPGAVILKDSFDSNDLGWKANDGNSTVVIANGKLYLRANKSANYGAVVCEGCSTFKDNYYFQADIAATRSFHGGLIFSMQDPDDFYVFQIESCCQKYSLLKHTAGGWEDLKLLISSAAINITPNPNTLGVLFVKGKITLYINGVLLDTINDPKAIMGGQVGIIIVEPGVNEIVDNLFSYQVPDSTLVSPTPVSGVDIAHPTYPGGPGAAINLKGDPNSGKQLFATNCQTCHIKEGKGGITNPGSADGTVPPLNPIDPTLISSDLKTYASNLDLFIEHGSRPQGNSPVFSMPAYGDKKALNPQQIADVIAYLISLNPVTNAAAAATTAPTPAASTPQSTLPIQSGCIPWDQVSSADVGKSMCVTGIIVQRNYVYDPVNYNDSYISYQFTKTDPDAFRFTWSYGDYSRPSISECVNVTGIVMINGKSLYMKYPFLSKCTP